MTKDLLITTKQGPGIGRESRDRLEVLTALIEAPSFDAMLRDDVIQFPLDHPVYRWNCLVERCERPQLPNTDCCHNHSWQWREAKKRGLERGVFLRTAEPLEALEALPQQTCRVPLCGRPAQRTRAIRLCRRHNGAWDRWCKKTGTTGSEGLAEWMEGQQPLISFGECVVVRCSDLAESPLGLCDEHLNRYRKEDRPGNATVDPRWSQLYEQKGMPVPVQYEDWLAFERWCATTLWVPRAGQLDLRGLHPLVRAELKWGLFRHMHNQSRNRWWLHWLRTAVAHCQGVGSLMDFDLKELPRAYVLPVLREIIRELRVIYATPANTRKAGYIEFTHHGPPIKNLPNHFDLNCVPQQWLRDLLWDFFAALLRSPNPPRGRSFFSDTRRACQQLGVYLELEAFEGGNEPALLRQEHVYRFVADQRRRWVEGLPTLAPSMTTGEPVIATESTHLNILNRLRRMFRWAADTPEGDTYGFDRGFLRAFPASGSNPRFQPRSPFSDEVARALAEEDNLQRLAELDPEDRGLRDIWETIVATGRRAGEVLNLRLDCTRRHNGFPLLWHDQTKVGNFNEAIRIPERIHERLLQRRSKTLEWFFEQFGREPTVEERSKMALFPTSYQNPRGDRGVTYTWFNKGFTTWVHQLDLGAHVVVHQARHTLATKLLAAGAGLHHIKRYLGHVSVRMAEHYAKVAPSELDEVLQHVWVAGPGAANPGKVLSRGVTPLSREEALALALDLNRRSTPADGGQCTYQVVVDGGACPWNLDCENCDKFVMTGADLLYWRRKREQWMSIAERAPDDVTADYLHKVFEPTARAIEGLERVLAGLGLLEDALSMDLRRPQDYFHRIWNLGFRASELAALDSGDNPLLQEASA